jgi:hypothetical protein
MARTKEELTGEFTAKTASGEAYRVYEFTTFLDSTTLSDTKTQWTPGVKAYRLRNGDHVNPVDGGLYEIARTGQKLTRSR